MDAPPEPSSQALTAIAEMHTLSGLEHLGARRLADAEAHLRAALSIKPNLVPAYALLGTALDEDRPEEAIAVFRRGLALEPDNGDLKHVLGMSLLRSGQWAEGWPRFLQGWARWREQVGARLAAMLAHLSPKREWDGRASLPGKTLLVVFADGFGDTFQFCRFLPGLAAAGARVIVACQKPVAPLLRTLDGVAEVVSRDDLPPAHDYWVEDRALPALLDVRPETLPLAGGYLRADPDRVAWWHSQLPSGGPRVGLVWAGSQDNDFEPWRSIQPPDLAPALEPILASLPGATFVSLNVGPRSGEAYPLGIHDATPLLHDYADTAALLAALDLTITVETSVAHLAGASGLPVWVLLARETCWRWLRDREDSPWYRSSRLFRQARLGDWRSVTERVASELAARFANQAA